MDGQIVRFDPKERSLVEVEREALLAQIDRFCAFEEAGANGQLRPVDCPLLLARLAYDRIDFDGMPTIKTVLKSPGLLRDGRIISCAGYDRPSQAFLECVWEDWDESKVIRQPTEGHAKLAYKALARIFSEFDFVDPDGPVGVVAAILTLVGRQVIQGNVPVFSFLADMPGAGKTALIDAVSTIAYGERLSYLRILGKLKRWKRSSPVPFASTGRFWRWTIYP